MRDRWECLRSLRKPWTSHQGCRQELRHTFGKKINPSFQWCTIEVTLTLDKKFLWLALVISFVFNVYHEVPWDACHLTLSPFRFKLTVDHELSCWRGVSGLVLDFGGVATRIPTKHFRDDQRMQRILHAWCKLQMQFSGHFSIYLSLSNMNELFFMMLSFENRHNSFLAWCMYAKFCYWFVRAGLRKSFFVLWCHF